MNIILLSCKKIKNKYISNNEFFFFYKLQPLKIFNLVKKKIFSQKNKEEDDE